MLELIRADMIQDTLAATNPYTGQQGRAFLVPRTSKIPQNHCNDGGRYCLASGCSGINFTQISPNYPQFHLNQLWHNSFELSTTAF